MPSIRRRSLLIAILCLTLAPMFVTNAAFGQAYVDEMADGITAEDLVGTLITDWASQGFLAPPTVTGVVGNGNQIGLLRNGAGVTRSTYDDWLVLSSGDLDAGFCDDDYDYVYSDVTTGILPSGLAEPNDCALQSTMFGDEIYYYYREPVPGTYVPVPLGDIGEDWMQDNTGYWIPSDPTIIEIWDDVVWEAINGPSEEPSLSAILGPLSSYWGPGFTNDIPVWDPASFELTFVPEHPFIQFEYVFGSDEYTEFVYDDFNDIFAFFVNGVDVTLLPNQNVPVTINTVNNVSDVSDGGARPNGYNPQFFIDNDTGSFKRVSPVVDTEMDGLTTILAIQTAVNPGVPNTLRFVVGDTLDRLGDTFVAIRTPSLVSIPNLTDTDGDGLIDALDSCPTVFNTGLDSDGDGVDDACDTPPVAVNDNYTIDEDTVLTVAAPGVLANDTDADGDALQAFKLTNPAKGTVSNFQTNGSFKYTPPSNFNGQVSFTYSANDGANSAIATVTIIVQAVNDLPVGNQDVYVADSNITLVMADHPEFQGVLWNDQEFDAETMTAQLVALPARPLGQTLAGGQVTNWNTVTGKFDYKSPPGFVGEDRFQYRPSDGTNLGNLTWVLLRVINTPPTAQGDEYFMNEDVVLTVNTAGLVGKGILANDHDINSNPLTPVLESQPQHGQLQMNPDGSFTYTPNQHFNGTDSFRYHAFDGFPAGEYSLGGDSPSVLVQIHVAEVNDAPVATPDAYSVDEDQVLTVPSPGILANDSDVENQPFTAVLDSGVSNGTLVLQPDGSFVYTPNPNFNGIDTFTYHGNDGQPENPSGPTVTVTITVNPVNDPPVAVDDAHTVEEDGILIIPAPGVISNDSDVDGDPLTVEVASGVTHGTLVLNADGSFTYTPDADYNGNDGFTYTLSDGQGGTATGTVHLTVTPVNDSPVAVDDAHSVDEDAVLEIPAPGVLINDSDLDGDALTVSPVAGPSHGTLAMNADGSFSYTPEPNYNGLDAFEYEIADGNGGTDTATVSITVIPANDPPVAAEDHYNVDEDTVLVVSIPGVLVNDTDIDGDSLAVLLVNGPANGEVVLNGDGSFTYTPNPGFNGLDSFNYTVSDSFGGSSTTTVFITVNPVNDPPAAVDDAYSVRGDTTLTVAAPGILGNDSDPEGDDLVAALATGPVNGTVVVNADGSFDYLPNPGFVGVDSFQYTVGDGNGGEATGTVTIEVTPANDPPDAADDTYTTTNASGLVVPAPGVLSNDSDPDGDVLTASVVSGPASGILAFNPDGSFAYTPEPVFTGTVTFSYQVSDPSGATDVATVTIVVTQTNRPPVVTGALPSEGCLWPPNHKFVDILIAGVVDPDGDNVTIVINGITSDEPTMTQLGSGGPDHAPDATGVGTSTASVRAERSGLIDGRVYEIHFTASDPGGASSTGSVLVQVPHDQRGGYLNCDAVNSGQFYDATTYNEGPGTGNGNNGNGNGNGNGGTSNGNGG